MPVFPLSQDPQADGSFSLSPEDWKHLTRALRLKDGDLFAVRLLDGSRGEAKLLKSSRGWEGLLMRQWKEDNEPSLSVHLGIGLIRWSRLEWLVEKATELGAVRVSLLRLRYSQELSSNITSKINRLIKITQESLKQCERPKAPQIDGPMSLQSFASVPLAAQKIFLQERSQAPLLKAKSISQNQNWMLAVGPEGGFHPEEIEQMRTMGFQACSLGHSIYRAETAALYALAVLDYLRKAQS